MWSLDGAASLVLRSTPAGLALGLREELDVPPRTLTRLHEQLTLHGRRADASGLFTGIGSLRLGQTELGRWDGVTLTGWPVRTWVLGREVYNEGRLDETVHGGEASFDHARGGYWRTG